MIDTSKKIKITDRYGHNEEFELRELFYEDDTHIIGNVYNDDWYDGPLKVVIYRRDCRVIHDELEDYYASNY